MARIQHNSFLLTSLPSDRRGRTTWLTLAWSQLFFAFSAPNIAAPHSQANKDCGSLLTMEQLLPSSPSSVLESSGISESKYCTGLCGPSVAPAAILPLTCSGNLVIQNCPLEGPCNFRGQGYFISRRRAPGSFMWDSYSAISEMPRFRGIFYLIVKSKWVPILNYSPILEFTFRGEAWVEVCLYCGLPFSLISA